MITLRPWQKSALDQALKWFLIEKKDKKSIVISKVICTFTYHKFKPRYYE
jgi:hypothetical protein